MYWRTAPICSVSVSGALAWRRRIWPSLKQSRIGSQTVRIAQRVPTFAALPIAETLRKLPRAFCAAARIENTFCGVIHLFVADCMGIERSWRINRSRAAVSNKRAAAAQRRTTRFNKPGYQSILWRNGRCATFTTLFLLCDNPPRGVHVYMIALRVIQYTCLISPRSERELIHSMSCAKTYTWQGPAAAQTTTARGRSAQP
jgi:hypothetical protein